MNVYDIEKRVKAGEMKLLFTKEIRPCMSESLANELAEKGVTEFANFGYTDYGSLYGGMADYTIIRYFEENYHGEGMTIETTSWGGKNMILYGDALKHALEEVAGGKDDFGSLLSGLEDYFCQYEWEGCCEEAKALHEDERFVKYDEQFLARCIEECNSGQSNTNTPDYSESELLKRLAEGE